jgi:tetratricopeptide (TPR) repeat protein
MARGMSVSGLIERGADTRRFVAAATAGAAVAGIIVWLVDGRGRFVGVALPLGCAAAMMSFVLGSRRVGPRNATRSHQLAATAVVAGLMAHFVESQFGVVTSVTHLLFWTYAAIALVLPNVIADPRHDEHALAPPSTLGLVLAFALMILTFDFRYANIGDHGKALAVLFGGTWLLSSVVICVEHAHRPLVPTWRRRLLIHCIASLAPWLGFMVTYPLWSSTVSRDAEVSLLYLAALFTAALVPLLGIGRKWQPSHSWRGPLCAILAGGAVAAIVWTNLNLSRADAFNRGARVALESGRIDDARTLAAEALRLNPDCEQYATDAARTLIESARLRPDHREHDLEDADALLTHARRTSPLNPDHPRNLARLHRLWAALSPAAATRHASDADAGYVAAEALLPNDAQLLNEHASMFLEQGHVDRGLALLDRSVALDEGYADTYAMRADVHFQRNDFTAALADYEQALRIDGDSVSAPERWSGKALALARLRRLPEAIEANRRVLAIKPGDVTAHRNLAILYRETGQVDAAVLEAQAALGRATPEERGDLERFIESLTGQKDGGAPD